MRAASAAFLRTVTGSHTIGVRARACTVFQSGTGPTGTFLDVLDGDAMFDALAPVRSTLDITVNGKGLWPRLASDPLAPYGNEIYVERGVDLANGSTEWVGLGYFRIDTPEQQRPPDGAIRVSASDRMAGIVDSRLTVPVQFAATATYGTVVATLVNQVYPSAIIDWDDGTIGTQIGRAVIATDDRYQFLDDLVTSVGKIWYWDYRGRLQIKNTPSLASPVVDIVAGRGGVLVSSSRSITRVGVYNAYVVTGQAADANSPATAISYDNNPASPTYWNGRFGQVPGYYTSAFVTDQAQAQAAADALVARSIGLPYAVDFQSIPNPALEPWDVIRLRQDTRMGVEIHQIRQVTIPLVASRAMTAQTKEQTQILIGRA